MKNKNYLFSKIGVMLTAACCLTATPPSAMALSLTSRTAAVQAAARQTSEEQVIEVASLKDFQSKNPELYETYVYTGEAVVAYVDHSVQPAVYYLVDAEGGVQFKDEWGMLGETTYKVGDRLTQFMVGVTGAFGANTIYPFSADAQVVSQGNEVQPVEATIAQIKAAPATYYSRLVRVADVTLSVAEGVTQFAEGMQQPTFTDAEGQSGKLRVLKGTTLIGTDIPTEPISLVGLMTSKAVTNGPILAPRSVEDLQAGSEQTPEEQTIEVASLKDLQSKNPELFEMYQYTGQAVVAYVDKSVQPAVYYLVDAEGGVQLKDEFGALGDVTYEPGDCLTNITLGVSGAFGANIAFPFTPDAQVVSKGNEVQPVEATIAQIKAAPATYYSRLVRVADVTLSVAEGVTQFAEGMQQPTFTDAEGQSGKLRVLKGTTLIGTDIPTEPVSLVGLMTSKAVTNGPILAPRSVEDLQVTVVAEPSIEVDTPSFPTARGRVGEKVEIGTVHVTAVALPHEVSIVPSGSVEGIFTTDVTTLPKGTYEKDITIYYEAKAIGKHKGNLYFMIGEDPYAQISINGMAIDPNNPPAVTVDPQTFEPFVAKVGETVQQTLKVTPTGMPDYVKVAITPGQGFTTNTTMLMTSGEQNLNVTFRPTQAGEFAATITIQNEFIEPIVLQVTGKATDETVAPETEGDALPLSTENPLTLLNETFDAGSHNKPLALEGRKNLAMEGTRAWWGYTFPEYEVENQNEKVAKVTAYDSKANEETPCEMLLVSPPLNYKESASKLFTFRVMGNNLTDNMTDELELCYIYLDGDQMVVEPLNEVQMPAMKDLNDEWQEFHVDLANQNIDDVFFMGFRFKSMRGSNHSAIYYVDDVTYGRTDVPLISTSLLTLEMSDSKENTVVQSEPIEVEGSNLNEPIKLALGGADKDKFELSAASLEPAGGVFNVRFSGKMGNYEAYVKLSSRGAADKYIFLFASVTQGIESLVVDAQAPLTVTDLSGRKVRTLQGADLDKALDNLPTGTYIITFATENGMRSIKMAK